MPSSLGSQYPAWPALAPGTHVAHQPGLRGWANYQNLIWAITCWVGKHLTVLPSTVVSVILVLLSFTFSWRDLLSQCPLIATSGSDSYLHTCILAYLHTCILAYLHTWLLAFVHTCILAYLHTYKIWLWFILAYRILVSWRISCYLSFIHFQSSISKHKET